MLLSSAIFLHPLFDDFGDTLGFFFRQYFQVIDHHVDRRAWWRQVIVFQQRHHRHAAGRGRFAFQGRHAVQAQGGGASHRHAIRAGGSAAGQCQGGIELFQGRRRQARRQQAQQRAQDQEVAEDGAQRVQQPAAEVDDGIALFPPLRHRRLGGEGQRRQAQAVAALHVDAQAAVEHFFNIAQFGGGPARLRIRCGGAVEDHGDAEFFQAATAALDLRNAAVVGVLARGGILAGRAVVGRFWRAIGWRGAGGIGRCRHGGGRRTVRQAAGNAGHGAVALLLFAHRLARHFRGFAIFFQRLVHAVVIHGGRHAELEVVFADDGAEQARDVAADFILEALGAFVAGGRGVEAIRQVDVRGQQVAALVDQAHARGRQAGDAARHHVDDGGDLFRRQGAARFQGHDDGGGRLVAIAGDERGRLGDRQMDARRSDRVHRHDALRQLAFQAAAEAHVLHELRYAQRVILVHQLQAGRQLRRHALRGQQHAHLAQHGIGHQHLAAVRMQAVGDVFGVQGRHHVRHGHLLARAKDRLVVGLVAPEIHGHHGGDADGQHDDGDQVLQQGGRDGGLGTKAPARKCGLHGGNHLG